MEGLKSFRSCQHEKKTFDVIPTCFIGVLLIRIKLAMAKDWMEIEFKKGMKINDLFEKLKYHPASIALISLNGTPVDEDAELKDGDEVVLVPTIGGGVHR